MDAGFTKSDCTYDVVATWKGKFFRLDDHLERFERSWNQLRFRPPVSREEIKQILMKCVKLSELRDSYVEMIITRGVPLNGERDPRKFSNRFYAFAIPYVWVVTPEDQKKGITTFIEIILNQELGEPFRRDAMKKPVKVAGIKKEDMRPQK